ncbi:dynamin family protein [Aspergillus steynii IBT 23096]|uniref:Dynamin family protein n=1 Tax=Aspergillus steynii IBT 23096 TaxID=1392250 RepID=A0A2I2G7E9_9EURO|nr:dynamin family protein [Aspergillus steynii IBT 23096]PLB48781.1 dynamin family protein [Aspergillus steynii IBT 23096]
MPKIFINKLEAKRLCTKEQLDLLNLINNLRSQGINQSSGKSSVLEAISGISFPVKSSLYTRFPTELVLRKSIQVRVRVSIIPHHSRSNIKQDSLGSFCEQLDDFEGLPALIDNVKAAMGITTYGKISGPDRPHLTIVDLPGLIHSETKQQSASNIQLVQDVVQTYINKPRSIILTVISAKNDFANQIPDTLVPRSESKLMFLSLAKNQDVKFRLGWHILKNIDTEKGDWTLTDKDREEMLFFFTGAWEDLLRSLVGINGLCLRLSKVLLGQIAAELPSLINKIRKKADNCTSEIIKLGKPQISLDEQRSYLLHISQSFQSLVKAAVDGTYNDLFFGYVHAQNGLEKRLRAVIRTTRAEFTAYIRTLLRKTRGRELPGTFNPIIVRDLFLEQCGPWEKLTKSHIRKVWSSVRDFMVLAVCHVTDKATSTALIKEIIFFIFNSRFFSIADLHEPYYTGKSINLNQLLQYLLRQSEPDMVNFASAEALDCMLAYYKVALKHFVDDIANEAVELKLILALLDIFSPVVVFNMHDKRVTQIAGESEENRFLRD